MRFTSSTMKKIRGVMQKQQILPSLMIKDKNDVKLWFDLVASWACPFADVEIQFQLPYHHSRICPKRCTYLVLEHQFLRSALSSVNVMYINHKIWNFMANSIFFQLFVFFPGESTSISLATSNHPQLKSYCLGRMILYAKKTPKILVLMRNVFWTKHSKQWVIVVAMGFAQLVNISLCL